MMLALGMFVFSLSTAAYQELQRQTNWRHASNSRLGAVPARQFLGRDLWEARIVRAVGSRAQLRAIRADEAERAAVAAERSAGARQRGERR